MQTPALSMSQSSSLSSNLVLLSLSDGIRVLTDPLDLCLVMLSKVSIIAYDLKILQLQGVSESPMLVGIYERWQASQTENVVFWQMTKVGIVFFARLSFR